MNSRGSPGPPAASVPRQVVRPAPFRSLAEGPQLRAHPAPIAAAAARAPLQSPWLQKWVAPAGAPVGAEAATAGTGDPSKSGGQSTRGSWFQTLTATRTRSESGVTTGAETHRRSRSAVEDVLSSGEEEEAAAAPPTKGAGAALSSMPEEGHEDEWVRETSADQPTQAPRVSEALRVGDAVEFYSESSGHWRPTRITAVHADGVSVKVACRPDVEGPKGENWLDLTLQVRKLRSPPGGALDRLPLGRSVPCVSLGGKPPQKGVVVARSRRRGEVLVEFPGDGSNSEGSERVVDVLKDGDLRTSRGRRCRGHTRE